MYPDRSESDDRLAGGFTIRAPHVVHVSLQPALGILALAVLPLQSLSTPVLAGLAVVGLIAVVIAVRIAVALAIRVGVVIAGVLVVLLLLSEVGVDVPLFVLWV